MKKEKVKLSTKGMIQKNTNKIYYQQGKTKQAEKIFI